MEHKNKIVMAETTQRSTQILLRREPTVLAHYLREMAVSASQGV
jgi:hypothetical protein